jgi:hypothetical protein
MPLRYCYVTNSALHQSKSASKLELACRIDTTAPCSSVVPRLEFNRPSLWVFPPRGVNMHNNPAPLLHESYHPCHDQGTSWHLPKQMARYLPIAWHAWRRNSTQPPGYWKGKFVRPHGGGIPRVRFCTHFGWLFNSSVEMRRVAGAQRSESIGACSSVAPGFPCLSNSRDRRMCTAKLFDRQGMSVRVRCA